MKDEKVLMRIGTKATELKRETQIQSEFIRAQDSVDLLLNVVGDLESRLRSVLREEPREKDITEDETTKSEKPLVPIAGQIRSLDIGIVQASKTVTFILKTLEV